jgi:uncharacterized protein involved in exopolysaccharide biosynthesis
LSPTFGFSFWSSVFQEQKLLSNFSESSRVVESIRKQIALVEQFLEQQRARIGQGEFAEDLDRQIVGIDGELRFQEARRDSLLKQIYQLDQQIAALTDQNVEYRNLMREREASERRIWPTIRSCRSSGPSRRWTLRRSRTST